MISLTDAVARRILSEYGFSDTGLSLKPAMHGYRNTVYPFTSNRGGGCLIVYKPEKDITSRVRRVNRLGLELAAAGLPVRAPLDPRIMTIMHRNHLIPVAVYTYLPGGTIAWEGYTRRHLKLLGWALGSLHRHMQTIPMATYPTVVSLYSTILQRMAAYFQDTAIQTAMTDKLGVELDCRSLEHMKLFLGACGNLPTQVLHMDFVRGNILFGNPGHGSPFAIGDIALTGIIDFEKAAAGHPLFDIARTLAFLYADCASKTPLQLRRYVIDAGYRKRGLHAVKATSVSLPDGIKCDVLETAVTLFLLHDLYKFLRSNPYESLQKNHHYCRTRDLLVQRKMMRTL